MSATFFSETVRFVKDVRLNPLSASDFVSRTAFPSSLTLVEA